MTLLANSAVRLSLFHRATIASAAVLEEIAFPSYRIAPHKATNFLTFTNPIMNRSQSCGERPAGLQRTLRATIIRSGFSSDRFDPVRDNVFGRRIHAMDGKALIGSGTRDVYGIEKGQGGRP